MCETINHVSHFGVDRVHDKLKRKIDRNDQNI